MSYTKMTPGDFASKLEDGRYKTSTAAKRAVGKAKFNDAGKDKCYKAIVAHFGESAPAVEVRTPKVRKAAAKTNAKAAKKVPKAKSNKPSLFNRTEVALQELDLATQQVGTIVQAINAMRSAKEAYPDLDTSDGAKVAQAALTQIMEGVHANVMGTAEAHAGNGASESSVAERFAAAAVVANPAAVAAYAPGED